MNPSVPVCPVPAEQQPLNEYQELKESWFFRWATLGLRSYLTPILILWLLSWLVAAPVAAVSFPVAKYPVQFLLSAAAGAMVVPMLTLPAPVIRNLSAVAPERFVVKNLVSCQFSL